MTGAIPASWAPVLEPVFASEQARALHGWLDEQEEAGRTVYPPRADWLRALELTPLDKVKVVILGQDPYHGPGQAHGLAFSVPDGVKLPPSLRNVYKELEADCGVVPADGGDLTHWAEQGVLLLNNALTVEAGSAGSHQKRGWDAITDACVAAVARREKPSVFILWGSHAQAKARRVSELGPGTRHCVIATPHPSPLSAHRGFFGSRPFSRANDFLIAHGREPIRW
ncbi:uracil-DNA glycosylase [Croceicoccus ponticola]|uniref:Uracil-DNA glycosylase n=1 Tax=Croceicoccus ponticola TaxID=2217664 RepID=A0A437GYU9_9SPHN|nr:uracil-DNA glycosylase [Croceicoccus ponticola]RVQ67852.1 uracil-DNA glycosylase [Croceicoccus ponticola]